MMPPQAGVALLAAFMSAVAVGVVRWYALRRDVIDRPNERSSHSTPTPRGGGLGLLIGFALAAAWVPAVTELPLLAAFAGVAVTAMVGWRDDHAGATVRARLAVHLVAAGLVVPLALSGAPGTHWAMALSAVWWAFFTVSSINVVNFIDGVDGMIGLQAVVFGIHMAWNGGGDLHGPASPAVAIGAALAGASTGFLVWNWAPARIFLGDVGSGALGAIFVIGAVLMCTEGRTSPVHALLPLAAIFLDATVTLVRRARRGERVTVAHRSHLYQRLANGGWGHARVSITYGAAAALALPAAAPGGWLPVLGYLTVVGIAYALLDRSRTARQVVSD